MAVVAIFARKNWSSGAENPGTIFLGGIQEYDTSKIDRNKSGFYADRGW